MRQKNLIKCLVITLCLGLTTFTGCTNVEKNTDVSTLSTENGQTNGYAIKTSQNKGSASINISSVHVDMTNVSFATLDTSHTYGEINVDNQNLLYANVSGYDENNAKLFSVADGNFFDKFTYDTCADYFNIIYQTITETTDSPISTGQIAVNKYAYYISKEVDDYVLTIIAKRDTSNWAAVSIYEDYDGSNILYSCYKSLGGGTFSTSGEHLSEETIEEKVYTLPIANQEITLPETYFEGLIVNNETTDKSSLSFVNDTTEVEYKDSGIAVGDMAAVEEWLASKQDIGGNLSEYTITQEEITVNNYTCYLVTFVMTEKPEFTSIFILQDIGFTNYVDVYLAEYDGAYTIQTFLQKYLIPLQNN